MLKGHVDRFDETYIEGWAANTEMPNLAVVLCIEIDGGRLCKVATSIPRPDVERALGLEGRFGFRVSLTAGLIWGKTVSVRFEETAQLLENGSRSFPENAHRVITGKMGWYFEQIHEEISVIDAICADASVDVRTESTVGSLAIRLARLQRCAPSLCVIIPDKAVIYKEYLPEHITLCNTRLAKAVVDSISSVIYAETSLKTIKALSTLYHQTDTHLTDAGVLYMYTLIQTILSEKIGFRLPPVTVLRRKEEALIGDLAHPALGNVDARQTTLVFEGPEPAVEKNGKIGYGAVRFYKSDIVGPKVMIFGTSSGLQMAKPLSRACKELIFCFNHDVDYELIEKVKPDLILIVIPEKLLKRKVVSSGVHFDLSALEGKIDL